MLYGNATGMRKKCAVLHLYRNFGDVKAQAVAERPVPGPATDVIGLGLAGFSGREQVAAAGGRRPDFLYSVANNSNFPGGSTDYAYKGGVTMLALRGGCGTRKANIGTFAQQAQD